MTARTAMIAAAQLGRPVGLEDKPSGKGANKGKGAGKGNGKGKSKGKGNLKWQAA